LFAKFSPLILKQLVETINAQEHIGAKVSLKVTQSGALGICPFHDEKTPSFYVYSDHFHCFGCRAHGSIIDFEMRYNTQSFPEAVVQLAQKYNFFDLLGPADPEAKKKRQERLDILRLMEGVNRLYEACLKSPLGKGARAYVQSRGLSDSFAQSMGLGFCPKSQDSPVIKALKSGLFPRDLFLKAGVLKESQKDKELYDFFRERLIIPIHNEKGQVVAFGGRVLPGASPSAPKYLNSSESLVFHKSKTLFNLHRARKSIVQERTALLVEGYMDAMALVKYGFPNVVAVLGTALTIDHIKILAKFCDKVILMMDSDGAGQRALAKSFEVIFRSNLLEGCYCSIKGAKDPDEFLAKNGPEELRRQLDNPRPLLYAALDACCAEGDSLERRLRNVQRFVVPIILQNPHKGQQEIALKQAAHYLGLSSPQVFLTQQSETISSISPVSLAKSPHPVSESLVIDKASRPFMEISEVPENIPRISHVPVVDSGSEVRLLFKSTYELKTLILLHLVPPVLWPNPLGVLAQGLEAESLVKNWLNEALSPPTRSLCKTLGSLVPFQLEDIPLKSVLGKLCNEKSSRDYMLFFQWLILPLCTHLGLDINGFPLDNAKFVIGVIKTSQKWIPFPQTLLNRMVQDALLVYDQGAISDELKRTLRHLEKQGLTVILSQAMGSSSQSLSSEEMFLCKERIQFCLQELRGTH